MGKADGIWERTGAAYNCRLIIESATLSMSHLIVQGAVQADEVNAGISLALPCILVNLCSNLEEVLFAAFLLPEAA